MNLMETTPSENTGESIDQRVFVRDEPEPSPSSGDPAFIQVEDYSFSYGSTRVLHELKRRGVKIALDDFGSGQASLSHLRRFPFDDIKIDRSVVTGVGSDRNDEKLIQAIIRLAHALDMKVVAEGVETEAQRGFLKAEGCDYIQGYLVGMPAA